MRGLNLPNLPLHNVAVSVDPSAQLSLPPAVLLQHAAAQVCSEGAHPPSATDAGLPTAAGRPASLLPALPQISSSASSGQDSPTCLALQAS